MSSMDHGGGGPFNGLQIKPDEVMASNRRAFQHQCDVAREKSLDGSTYHVNATVGVFDDEPMFLRFYVSDWYSTDSTLRSFANGRQRE